MFAQGFVGLTFVLFLFFVSIYSPFEPSTGLAAHVASLFRDDVRNDSPLSAKKPLVLSLHMHEHEKLFFLYSQAPGATG